MGGLRGACREEIINATINSFNSALSWSNAGWKVESLDFNEKWVKFVRAGGEV